MFPRAATIGTLLAALFAPGAPCHATDAGGAEVPDSAATALGRRATQWSVAATALPLALGGLIVGRSVRGSGQAGGALLVTAGLVFGPVAGYSVGGRPGRGWSGAALRTAIAVGGLGMTIAAVGQAFESESDSPAPAWIMGGAAAAILGLAAYDVATVGGYVARAPRSASRPALVPVVGLRRGGLALAIHARF